MTATSLSDFAIKKRTEKVLRHLSLENKVMLDIGCNNGLYTIKFFELAKDIIGIDIDRVALKKARGNNLQLYGNAEFIRARAEYLPFRDLYFDVIILIETLEHVQNQEMAMKEVGRILKKDGYLVLYIPNRLYPLETHGARIGKKYIMGFHGSVPLLS